MAEESEEEGKKGGKGKLIVIAVVALLILGGGGGAAAYFLLGGASEEPAAEEDGEAGEETASEEDADDAEEVELDEDGRPIDPTAVSFVELPDMLVNITSSGDRARFLKLRAALEVSGDEEAAAAVERLTPRIVDGMQFYLRALTVDELRGVAGMHRLKQELRARVNDAIAPLKVRNVLIKEMLVQ